jgi:hypothetical protein
MKNVKTILVMVFMLVLGVASHAQDETADYFMGDWNVVVEGTPNGDAKMVMTIYQKDGKLAGEMSGAEEGIANKFSRVEVKNNSITVYWLANGYDVYLLLEKTESDKLEGALMDMFDASAERVKE